MMKQQNYKQIKRIKIGCGRIYSVMLEIQKIIIQNIF